MKKKIKNAKKKKYDVFFEKYTTCYINEAKDKTEITSLDRKRTHSYRVRDLCFEISDDYGFSDKELEIINVIGLFHDLGRFEQFKKYKTYVDKISINHALLSSKILENIDNEKNILSDFNSDEKKLIYNVIKNHNLAELPQDIAGRELFFSDILRDADKLDWLYAAINIIPNLDENEQYVFYADKDNKTTDISKKVYSAIKNKEIIMNSDLSNRNEILIAKIGMIPYQYKLKKTLEFIKKENYLKSLYSLVHETEETRRIYKLTNERLDKIILD